MSTRSIGPYPSSILSAVTLAHYMFAMYASGRLGCSPVGSNGQFSSITILLHMWQMQSIVFFGWNSRALLLWGHFSQSPSIKLHELSCIPHLHHGDGEAAPVPIVDLLLIASYFSFTWSSSSYYSFQSCGDCHVPSNERTRETHLYSLWIYPAPPPPPVSPSFHTIHSYACHCCS